MISARKEIGLCEKKEFSNSESGINKVDVRKGRKSGGSNFLGDEHISGRYKYTGEQGSHHVREMWTLDFILFFSIVGKALKHLKCRSNRNYVVHVWKEEN